MTLRVGNAQGFWGDSPGAAALLVSQQPDLDYVTMDYLSELSLSIMAIQQERDPSAGYARDFLEVIQGLIPLWQNGIKTKVITNAGGLNPQGCAEECLKILQEVGCSKTIGIVFGDNVLAELKNSPSNPLFANLESQKPLSTVLPQVATANAYLGAAGIVEALKKGADIVITGRVADPSLTVGPAIFHYDWSENEYEKISGATIAGHLIECGTQVTGGFSTHWCEIESPAEIGFPIAEIQKDGSCILTKPLNTGGEVTEETVKEQLLYEIGDPDNYLSPDVTASFLSLQVNEETENRVKITGAKGRPPPVHYKVSATYRDGYRAEAILTVVGHEAKIKAQRAGQTLLKKIELAGYKFERSLIECLGTGDTVPDVLIRPQEITECVLRIAVHDHRKKAVELFTKEIAPLITSGPQGLTGYASGRPSVRQVFGYWPCLIARTQVHTKVEIIA